MIRGISRLLEHGALARHTGYTFILRLLSDSFAAIAWRRQVRAALGATDSLDPEGDLGREVLGDKCGGKVEQHVDCSTVMKLLDMMGIKLTNEDRL